MLYDQGLDVRLKRRHDKVLMHRLALGAYDEKRVLRRRFKGSVLMHRLALGAL